MLYQHASSGSAPVFSPRDAARHSTQSVAAALSGSAVPQVSAAQQRAPYAEALRAHTSQHPISLMVPGHGASGQGSSSRLADFLGEQAVTLDLSPMMQGVDLGPDSPLAEAQRLAAEAWGAKRTWFMTNGASQANRTAALAVRGLGERIVSQRSAHSSFSDGVLLGGLIPTFVQPHVDRVNGIAHGVTPQDLDEALREAAAAGAPANSVYIISPSYFGSVSDVRGLADVAHEHGVPLIVDNAWGAHFGFHPSLPESPARLGADLVISSTHKLAGSLTQSAMLHLGEGEFAAVLEPLIDRAVMLTSSTSTSALLLSSLDIARQSMMNSYREIGESVAHAERFRKLLRADGRFSVVSDHFGDFPDVVDVDLLRVPVDVTRLGVSGHWVRNRLIEHFHVNIEMSTATTVVAVIGAGKTPDLDAAFRALQTIADETALPEFAAARATVVAFPELPGTGTLRMRPRDAYFAETEVVSAAQAVGRVSADSLAAYPPGIPNVLPGEEITAEAVAFLTAVAASPTGYVRGALDPLVATVRVVARDAETPASA